MNIIQKIDFNNKIINDDTFKSAYYYWCDKLELQKLISFDNKHKYIPCCPYENINYNNLIGKNVLIFFKNPKILYGILKIESILVKEEKYYLHENNNFDDNNFDDNNFDELNKLKVSDAKLYLNLIKKYNMVEIPSLFFIKFDCIYTFEYEIEIKNFNQYLTLENTKTSDILLRTNKKIVELEFNYPKTVKPKHIIKSYYNYFQTYLFDYIKYLEKKLICDIKENNNSSTFSQDNISTFSQDNSSTFSQDNISKFSQDNISTFSDLNSGLQNIHTNINNGEFIDFKIPILWNGCDKIIKKFKKQKIDKNLIFDHWENCKKCEIINNNINKLEIRDNKIVIKNIESKSNFTIMEQIINDYKNIRNFSYPKLNSDFEFDNKKINIIYCFESNSIYKNCFFMLNK